jgi:transcriptional repressor NrdR
LRCPYCKEDASKVIDSRPAENGLAIRRRRQCMSCKRRYTSYERIEESPLKAVKKDQSREPFDRIKLKSGVERACWKRPVSTQAVEDLVSAVESEVYEEYDREVPTSALGEKIMSRLRDLDAVAYIRFASVYRDFKDAGGFTEVLEEIVRNR